jgi:methyl coenzyme M reductase subunit C-like uncharacterized protein (methanogenesis marker protein 7)
MNTPGMRNLIDAFGGQKAVAELVGVKQAAVSMALIRGHFPHRWRMTLYREATARNIDFDPALLGLEAAQ